MVVARSTDGGQSWSFVGKALEQNPENYCPMGDTNDNGQGHAFVMTVGGTTYLYTLNRPAGDNLGVGLLVHSINASAANPVANLPKYEPIGTDPDTLASGATVVPTTGSTGVTIPVNTLGSGVELVTAGQFEDLNATSPSVSVINCTGTTAAPSALTGCTTAAGAGLAVASGDPLLQVMGDATTAVSIPQGPNTTAETGGVSLALNAPLSTIAAANVPGRFFVDGAKLYCVNLSSNNQTLENCTTTQSGGVSVSVGDAVTSDPIVPADYGQPNGALQTNGLVAPDGIVGVIPSSISYSGAPSGSTVIIYGEKILNYFIEGTVTLTLSPGNQLPESPVVVALPVVALAGGGAVIFLTTTRRRRSTARRQS